MTRYNVTVTGNVTPDEAYRKLDRKTKETLAKLQGLIERDEAGRCLPWTEETEAVYARWEKLYRDYRDAQDCRIDAARAAEPAA